jgi:hypothetical protein
MKRNVLLFLLCIGIVGIGAQSRNVNNQRNVINQRNVLYDQHEAAGDAAWTPPQPSNLKFWAKHDNEAECNAGTYTDSSGQGNDGTQTTAGFRPAWASDEDGNLKFNGTDERYVVPNAAEVGSGSGSIAIWMKNGSLPSGGAFRDIYTDKGTPPEGIRITYSGAATPFFTVEGYDAGAYQFRLNYNLGDTSSYHLVVGTFENNSANMYIDGILRATDTSCTISYTTATINIGRDSAYGRYSDAFCGEVMIWPGTIITSNEQYTIYQHFNP